MERMMKDKVHYIVVVLFLALTLGSMSSCSDDDEIPSVTPTDTGVMQDKDGNEYKWVRIGNLDWMAENLHCGIPFYEDADNDKWGIILSLPGDIPTCEQYFQTFGNYYSWQEAMDNAPDGWRLPTDEDWKKLEKELGMKSSDLDNEGWRNGSSYLMTQDGEGTLLNMRYGGCICYFGYYNMSIYHYYDFGYYWTATSTVVNNEPAAYARMITPGRNAVNRLQVLQEKRFMSVRYVRDAQ